MSLMDLSGTIRRLGVRPVTVTRRGAPTVTKGRVTPATPTTHSINANVQPLSGSELLRLPEGLRTRETVALWTDGDLRTADESAGVLADTVTVSGRTYEIELVEDWQFHGGYRRFIAAKVEGS